MSAVPDRVRCYNCGRPGPRSQASCSRCGANFRALCECAAEICIYDDECGVCRLPHVPKRMPLRKHPAVRAAKWIGAAAVAAFAAQAWLVPKPSPTWKLKYEGYAAWQVLDYETAAKKYAAVTQQNPADAEGWYMYALVLRGGGKFGPDVYVPLAEKAALLAPGLFAVRSFLAQCHLEAGRVDAALEHAEAAARAPEAGGPAHRLVAKIELRRPKPNLPRVVEELEKARVAGDESPDLKILLADVSLRLYGGPTTDATRLPPDVAVRLRAAKSAFEQLGARERESETVALGRAQISLALGDEDEAIAAAEAALNRAGPDVPKEQLVQLKLVRGAALFAHAARKSSAVARSQALADLAAVLREAPQTRVAAWIDACLSAADAGEASRALLSAAADAEDPTGGVRAVLAVSLLAAGKPDDAAASIAKARAVAPNDASFAEIEGAVRSAQRRPVEARAAYSDAARLAPSLAGPRIGRAMAPLAAAAAPPDAETIRGVVRELEEVRAKFGDEPRLLTALGAAKLAADDVAGARELLEKAKELAPADAGAWRTLAVARLRSKTPDAAAKAAEAFARARVFAPLDLGLVLAEARARLAAGDAGAAVAVCTDHLHARPDEPTVLALRADAFRRLRMWTSAVTDLKKLRLSRPDDDALLKTYVQTLFAAGDPTEARRAIDAALPTVSSETAHFLEFLAESNAGDVDAAISKLALGGPTTLLAEVQIRADRPDDAAATLRKFLADRPGDATASRLLVLALLDDENPAPDRMTEARAVVSALPADAPKGVRELLEGDLLLAAKDHRAAAERLDVAARELPFDPFAAVLHAEALWRGGDRGESLAEFRRGAALPSASFGARRIAADRLVAASAEAKDEDAAESLAREAARIVPRDAGVALRLAEVLYAKGDAAGAVEAADRGLAAVEGDTPARAATRLRYIAAAVRIPLGRCAEAETLLAALDPAERASPVAAVLRGFAALGATRFADADREFAAALALDGRQSAASIGRLETALASGSKPSAAAIFESWRAANPTDRGYVMTATRLFERRGYVEDAVAMASRALAAAPEDLILGAEVARVCAVAGRPEAGVDALRQVVARAPAERRDPAKLRLGAFMLTTPRLAAEALSTARELSSASDARTALEARVLESEALLAAGRPSEAEVAARAVAARWKDGQIAPQERGLEARVHFVLGTAAAASIPRRGEAIEHLSACLTVLPDDAATMNNLAWLFGQRQESAGDGAALAKKLTARSPNVADYWRTRGQCSRGAGDLVDAAGAFGRARDLMAASPTPDRGLLADTTVLLIDSLVALKRPDDARALAKSAIDDAKGTASEARIREAASTK